MCIALFICYHLFFCILSETVDDVDAFGWALNLTTLQIVWLTLTMPSYRNPSGITFGYTSLDKMLPALSKVSTILLNQHFRFAQLLGVRLCLIKQACQSPLSLNQHFSAVDNVYAFGWLLNLTTLQIVDTFYLSAFTFHLFNACFLSLLHCESSSIAVCCVVCSVCCSCSAAACTLCKLAILP